MRANRTRPHVRADAQVRDGAPVCVRSQDYCVLLAPIRQSSPWPPCRDLHHSLLVHHFQPLVTILFLFILPLFTFRDHLFFPAGADRSFPGDIGFSWYKPVVLSTKSSPVSPSTPQISNRRCSRLPLRNITPSRPHAFTTPHLYLLDALHLFHHGSLDICHVL